MITNVLLVDDDMDDQLLFKEAIELINPGVHCYTASNGKIGLDTLKLNQFSPDVIFLDLNMPVMNGFEFLMQIKKDHTLNSIPIGIFTTSNVHRDKELTKEMGAQFFLTKPNDFQVLRNKLQVILSSDFSDGEFISIP